MDEQRFRDAVECNRDMVFRVAYTYLRDWLVRVTVNECRSLFRRPWRRVEDIEAYANQLQMPSEGVAEDLEAAVEEVREFVLTPTA